MKVNIRAGHHINIRQGIMPTLDVGEFRGRNCCQSIELTRSNTINNERLRGASSVISQREPTQDVDDGRSSTAGASQGHCGLDGGRRHGGSTVAARNLGGLPGDTALVRRLLSLETVQLMSSAT